MELTFPVKGRDDIVVTAYASWDQWFPPDPTRRKVEIFKPGSGTAVAKKSDSGMTMLTVLKYRPTAAEVALSGSWKAKVTNLENSREKFRLLVSYPTDIQIKQFSVPISLINTLLGATISRINIHVTDGANKSYIKFPPEMGVQTKYFTVPSFYKKINMPWPIPDIEIRERVNDINSQSVTFSLKNASSQYANGHMEFKVKFEESGKEVLGTFHAHLSNMNLTIKLGFATRIRKISYNTNNIRTNFPCNMNIVGVPDFIEDYVLDPIIGYTEEIRNTVESAVKNIFASASMRNAFENAIMAKVSPFLGANPKIVSVKLSGGQLRLKYYND